MSEERTGPEPAEPDDLELEDDLAPEELDSEEDLEPEEAEPEPEPEPEPPRSRSRERITRQQRELQELRESNRRLTEALTRQPAQPQYQPPQPDPLRQAQLDAQEMEHVRSLPFEEQGRYWTNKAEQRLLQRQQLSELQVKDMLDQQNFKQIMRERRLPAKYETQVENLLSQARQQQMNPSREWLLKTVLGGEILEKKDRETDRARQRGQRRIASQTTRPGFAGASRSTAATSGGRRGQNQDAEDEALLRSVTWGEVNR